MARTKKEPILSPLERAFIDEYLLDYDGRAAAFRTGRFKQGENSGEVASNFSCKLLKRPYVKKEINRRILERSKRADITADKIILELAKVAFSNIGNLFDLKTGSLKNPQDMSPDDLAAVSSISIDEFTSGKNAEFCTISKKIRMYDKIRALEKLGQHLGLFNSAENGSEDLVSVLKNMSKNLPG